MSLDNGRYGYIINNVLNYTCSLSLVGLNVTLVHCYKVHKTHINCYKVELFIGYKFELDLLLNKSVVQ